MNDDNAPSNDGDDLVENEEKKIVHLPIEW